MPDVNRFLAILIPLVLLSKSPDTISLHQIWSDTKVSNLTLLILMEMDGKNMLQR